MPGESPNIVAVPASSPYRTFGDLLADAKANPGKINYGSAGTSWFTLAAPDGYTLAAFNDSVLTMVPNLRA